MTATTPSANPIGYRLKLEMKKRTISSKQLAKKADVKTSFIYDIISGKSANPSTVKLARVAESLGISLAYLAGGKEFIPEGSRPKLPDEYMLIPHVMVDSSGGTNAIISVEREAEPYYFRKGWLKEHLRAEPADLRVLHMRGDSMEPTLCHNDILLIDTTKKIPTPPGIFVLFDGFGLVTKRIENLAHARPPRVRVISDNPQYSIYERSIEDTFIIGRIVWFSRAI